MRTLPLLLLASQAFAGGVELQIQFSAVEKVLYQQMFTQQGRFFVKGTPDTKCSYAFLATPTVSGNNGKVQIVAEFNGKNATSIFGKCLGFGDTFPLRIIADLYHEAGLIRMRQVEVETVGKETYYARKVKEAITKHLTDHFSFKASDEAKGILERKQPNEAYRQQLTAFEVSGVRVTPEAIVLNVNLTLVIK